MTRTLTIACRNRSGLLRVSRLTRSFLYQPLAVLLAILILPTLSWFESGAGPNSGSSGAPFQASAQIVIGGCHPAQPNSIIQVDCPGGAFYAPDLYQLESDAVTAYLAEHKLPASDAHFIYDEGRTDLRNAIRATMFAGLLAIINKTASQRTQHEQNLYTWLQTLVQQNEIAEYTQAINQYHSWEDNPCGFKLDGDIASQYGLSYSGAYFCGSPLNQLFSGPPVPAESYFLAYGLKYSYGSPAQTYSYFADLVARTQLNVAEVFGIGLSAGAVVASASGGLIAAFSSELFPLAFGSNVPELFAAGEWLGSGAAEALTFGEAAGVAGGAAAIILIAVAIGVSAGFQAFSNEQIINDLNNLSNTLTQVTNNKPDLSAFAADTTGLGTYKLNETFVAQTLPGFPSSAALPAHRPGTDAGFVISFVEGPGVGGEELNYQDWYGLNWTARTYGGWFVQTCNSGSNCAQTDSMTAAIHYVDWAGTKWTASRIGTNFVNTKAAPASSDQPCPADETTGVTPGSDFSACISYVSSSVHLKDATGNPVTVSLTLTPAFSTSATLNFTTGQASTSTITVSGSPAPSISLANGLPAGFSFTPGAGTASLSYTNAPEGTYHATVVASNIFGTVMEALSIHVITKLSITSSSTLTGTAGLPINFLVTTTGDLPIKLSINAGLLDAAGLSFTDNGNGTATISGTSNPAVVGAGCFSLTDKNCGITATNATGSVTQAFSVTLNSPPEPTLVGPANATFTAGVPNSVRLVSKGSILPVKWLFNNFGRAPSWLSFHDNGDGTGVLSGTPPAGITGSYTFTLLPIAAGTLAFVGDFTVNVKDIPGFITQDIARFTTEVAASFAIQTDGPAADDGGATLPAGLTFESGNPANITGTPAVGTGGTYTLLLSATDSRGTGSQLLTLKIDAPPAITSANVANFQVGAQSSFEVTTLGFPSLSAQPNPTATPTSPDQGLGMHFDVQGLPAGFTASNLNPQGYATGTLTITGTPTLDEVGVHAVHIIANNGVGLAPVQLLYLSVQQMAPAPSSPDTCDGVYNGTITGNINVHPGQSCTLRDGHVTGSVNQNGGTLTLFHETVDGNVEIGNNQIGDGFDVEISKIGGFLEINHVMPGPALDRVCATQVTGYLAVRDNLTTIQVGNGCPANTIGNFLDAGNNTGTLLIGENGVTNDMTIENNSGNTQVIEAHVSGNVLVRDNRGSLTINNNSILNTSELLIQNNTGTTQVVNDHVGGALNCTGNTTITGNHDTAAQLLGQCAAF